jgi:hypothetical protein
MVSLVSAVGTTSVVAVLSSVLAGNPSVSEQDPATPEGVVQDYLSAVVDGDLETAASFLVGSSSCDVDDLEAAGPQDDVRIRLLDAETTGDRSEVRLEMVTSTGGPFGAFAFSEEHWIRLERSASGWLITGTPWPMFDCLMLGV